MPLYAQLGDASHPHEAGQCNPLTGRSDLRSVRTSLSPDPAQPPVLPPRRSATDTEDGQGCRRRPPLAPQADRRSGGTRSPPTAAAHVRITRTRAQEYLSTTRREPGVTTANVATDSSARGLVATRDCGLPLIFSPWSRAFYHSAFPAGVATPVGLTQEPPRAEVLRPISHTSLSGQPRRPVKGPLRHRASPRRTIRGVCSRCRRPP